MTQPDDKGGLHHANAAGNLKEKVESASETEPLEQPTRESASLIISRVARCVDSERKVGVLVEMLCETDKTADSETFQQLMNEIAKHIIGMNPVYLGRNEVPEDEIKTRIDRERRQALDEGTAAVLAEKVAWGRVERSLQSECLLDQPFYKVYSTTVESRIKDAVARLGEHLAIKRFRRYHLKNDASHQGLILGSR